MSTPLLDPPSVRARIADTLGDGGPVTLLSHGLAGSADDVRPLAAGLAGTRLLAELPGHGESDPLERPWTFADMAQALGELADGPLPATRAVGISVSAGALLHLAAHSPNRFQSLVLILPSALDQPSSPAEITRMTALGLLLEAGDVEGVASMLAAEVPQPLRDSRPMQGWLTARARALISRPAPWGEPDSVPVPDPTALRFVTARTLVIGQADDALHPAEVAEDVAAALPRSELLLLPPGSFPWARRRQVAAAVRDFLG